MIQFVKGRVTQRLQRTVDSKITEKKKLTKSRSSFKYFESNDAARQTRISGRKYTSLFLKETLEDSEHYRDGNRSMTGAVLPMFEASGYLGIISD